MLKVGKKRGPKTDNPKTCKITAKLDQRSREILEQYRDEKSVSLSEALRRGIKLLEKDLKK